MSCYIGLDIGGTKFMVASTDLNGKILRRVRLDTSSSLEKDLDHLHAMIGEVSEGQPIAGIGAAIGGPLDWKHGVVSPLHQPAWRDVPLKHIMETRWNCPFFVDVDTNVAAFGEYYLSNLNVHKFVYLTLSTGMGGGMLVDGKLDRGLHGAHPEMGHQSIAYRCQYPHRLQCECGVPDCLEALISGNGIRRIYQKPAEQLSAEEWDEVAYNLGQGLRNIATLYAPDLIHIGGGVAVGGGKKLIQAAALTMRDHLRIVPPPEVRLSTFGYDTALWGALTLAKQGIRD